MDDLFDMSDEDLEAAFKAARAEESEEVETVSEEAESSENESDNLEVTDEAAEEADEDESTDEESTESEEEETTTDSDDDTDEEKEEAGTESEQEGETSEPESIVFNAVGKEYSFTEDEMRKQFPTVFAQAMDYTRKLQTIAPWRKSIDAMEQAKMSHDDINLMIDAFKGDTGAIGEVLKRSGVDALTLTPEESTYVPNDYGRDSVALEINDVIDSIHKDPEYETTHGILTSGWDDASWQEFAKDPKKITQLHQDVKSGIYGKLQAEADKLKVFDGGKGRDYDYYLQAAKAYWTRESTAAVSRQLQPPAAPDKSQERVVAAQKQSIKREEAQAVSKRRKEAAPTGRTAQAKGATDYMDISEADFEDWYNRLEDR